MTADDAYSSLLIERRGPIAVVTLNRPQVHNALDATLVAEIRDVFRSLEADESARGVVLTGSGLSFCAGADLRWLQSAVTFSEEENRQDAMALTEMLDAIARCPKPVVARVNGAALAGGAGLVAASDIAIAADTARFGFTEARLGLVPATISPYVVCRIGESHARSLFLTAERFEASRAVAIGLVHEVVPADQLDIAVERTLRNLLHGGPRALAENKRLIEGIRDRRGDDLARYTADTIARLRVSAEGQEGLHAFLEKRPPNWALDT
ncbi:MAG: enoyl-CoA hydratase-related protein [Dehalococcoidia bacterium]